MAFAQHLQVIYCGYLQFLTTFFPFDLLKIKFSSDKGKGGVFDIVDTVDQGARVSVSYERNYQKVTAKAMDAIDCAIKGDLEFFKKAPLDILLNARDGNDDNILSIALKRCYVECCEVICRRCPSLLYHQNRPYGFTPLHHAAYAGKIEIVKLIISACVKAGLENQEYIESHGGDKAHPRKILTLRDTYYGENAMHKSTNNNQLEAAKLLIEADPDNEMLRAVNKKGETPLLIAINRAAELINSSPGGKDMVKLIMEKQPSQAKIIDMGNPSRLGNTKSEIEAYMSTFGPKTFSLTDLEKLTSNFSELNVVGFGGYGKVYRDYFPDGMEIAERKLGLCVEVVHMAELSTGND
ncbi:hypothetical protein FRX31_034630 [Thalictrum thalictroides]|uniref:Uncharacterized protein n=1 Tax=Thalictrum thalictroides TaxID=46969 RepID=A0A7J6UU54_THATH|nr:hypothetical protein FRX31_034630 [Thalictrum thalictroides]